MNSLAALKEIISTELIELLQLLLEVWLQKSAKWTQADDKHLKIYPYFIKNKYMQKYQRFDSCPTRDLIFLS